MSGHIDIGIPSKLSIRLPDGRVETYTRDVPQPNDAQNWGAWVSVPLEEVGAYAAVRSRRQEQDTKWGMQDHTLLEWMSILGEEYGEACTEANKAYFGGQSEHWSRLRKELEQTAAVCLAILLNMSRAQDDSPFGHEILRTHSFALPLTARLLREEMGQRGEDSTK